MWAEMKFPPINLHSVWPSKYMIELYDKYNGDDMSALDKQVDGDHYKTPIQPIEYIHANNIGFCEGNVIKYVSRWCKKNGLADLEKAKHYIELLIQLEKGDDNE